MLDHITTYEELSKIHGSQELIPYNLLLSTNEWKEKRKEILKRDSFVCQICKKRETKTFTKEGIKSIINSKEININWKIAGKNRTVIEVVNDGNYWFFSESTFKKYDAYDGFKYIKAPSGFFSH